MIFIGIVLIDLYIIIGAEEISILRIIELILSYSIIILQIFFFIKGIVFYQIENDKQNFYLLTIIASSITVIMLIISNIWLAVYILHTRFFVILVFSNSIIIQETYFKEYIKRRKIQLIFLIIMVLSLGVFYSLRTLAYG